MIMFMVNIHEAKIRLSKYVDAAERGQRVVICRRNRPVAELRPLSAPRTSPRPIGGAKGRVIVPPAFFEPLPDNLVNAFEGGAHTKSRRRSSR